MKSDRTERETTLTSLEKSIPKIRELNDKLISALRSYLTRPKSDSSAT